MRFRLVDSGGVDVTTFCEPCSGRRLQELVSNLVYCRVGDGRCSFGIVLTERDGQIEVVVGVVEVGEKLQSDGIGVEWPRLTCG
jgi:hypothetical protein